MSKQTKNRTRYYTFLNLFHTTAHQKEKYISKVMKWVWLNEIRPTSYNISELLIKQCSCFVHNFLSMKLFVKSTHFEFCTNVRKYLLKRVFTRQCLYWKCMPIFYKPNVHIVKYKNIRMKEKIRLSILAFTTIHVAMYWHEK